MGRGAVRGCGGEHVRAAEVRVGHGLKERRDGVGRNAEDETDIKWNWWTRLRLTLLAQLDRLDTLNAVHLGNHAPRAWASFRSETIGAAAVGFATAGNPRAAETILRRHPRAGGPSLLDALEALPETMSLEYPARCRGRSRGAERTRRRRRGARGCPTGWKVRRRSAPSRRRRRTERATRACRGTEYPPRHSP